MLYSVFPKWVSEKGILWGILAIIASIIAFSSRTMPLYLYILYFVEIIGFFCLSQNLSRSWARFSIKKFIKYLFWIGVLLRIPLTIYYHFHNLGLYGELYCYNLADIGVYVGLPYEAVNNIIQNGNWGFIKMFMKYLAFDDLGAPIFNTILLLLTGNTQPCLVPLIANIILGAYSSIFVYRIAQRHFGEDVARMSALFCMLNPNLIWWCSSLMKEIQMTFFTLWFLERMDAVLTQRNFSFAKIGPIALIGMLVFLYRAALGILLFLAFFATLVLLSDRIVSKGKKVLAGAMVAIVLVLGFGQQMLDQAKSMYHNIDEGGQQTNMEWRSTRENGNQFAKYAGASVFAPLIFTIPFPTISYTYEGQTFLMEVAGGNFVKNILSFFVILCMFMMLLSGEWRQHIFLIAYLIGYLVILVYSSYAQSGRFHVPALSFEMMFAAVCIQRIDQGKPLFRRIRSKSTYKKWFGIWCVAMFAACILWQWYKLKGQGLI